MTANAQFLWSRRWSFARGWTWVKEREVSPETANEWLAVFAKAEPKTEFRLSAKAPRITPHQPRQKGKRK